jgi:hypothetical protein
MRTPLALMLALAGCMAPAANEDPCPKGFCRGDGGGGPPPDLAGADLTGKPCTESWSCGPWKSSGNGMYSRTCKDANACGTSASKPDEGPIALPALDLDYYQCKVEPIVDRGCSMLACHGTAAADPSRAYRVFARGRRRNTQTVGPMCLENAPVDLDGMGTATVMCHGWTAHTSEEWQANYDSARALMLGVADPDQCQLLAQPLAGGYAHTGVKIWSTKQDPDYQTIRSWLAGARLGNTCVSNN